MNVTSIGQQTVNQAHNKTGYLGGYSFSLLNIPGNICKYAIPLTAMIVMANIPKVDSGPLSYAACCLACTASLPPAVPACLTLCGIILFFPSP